MNYFKKVFQERMLRAIKEDNMMRNVKTMVVPIRSEERRVGKECVP